MKKLLFSLVLAGATAASGAQFTVQSFFNPAVTSIIISNNVGVTNLNYIAQNMLQGLYQITTNSAGTAILGSIATNYCGSLTGTMYTDSVPVVWFGQTYPGTYTILTNQAVAASANTNDVRFVTITTNNQFNLFQDVLLPQDFFNTLGESGQPGAASTTNAIGYLQVVSQAFSLYGAATGHGSNIVNLILVPLASVGANNPGGVNSIPGFVPDLESTDAAQPDGQTQTMVISYTNQISLLSAPTVANIALPRWKFRGARGLRLRALYSGTSTNAISVNSVTLQTWTP